VSASIGKFEGEGLMFPCPGVQVLLGALTTGLSAVAVNRKVLPFLFLFSSHACIGSDITCF